MRRLDPSKLLLPWTPPVDGQLVQPHARLAGDVAQMTSFRAEVSRVKLDTSITSIRSQHSTTEMLGSVTKLCCFL